MSGNTGTEGGAGGARGRGDRSGASSPAPDAAGSAAAAAVKVTEVSGSDKTLSQAIKDGDVAKPDLMSYNAWISWRKAEGRSLIHFS